MDQAFKNVWPSFHPVDMLVGILASLLLFLVILEKRKNTRQFRHGEEYGSARWGNAKDIAPFMDKDPDQNIILTQTEGITMNNRPKDPRYARNKNIVVIGGSGSGKTRFFVKPSLMQLHSSYVITDPKGYNTIGQRKSHIVRLNLPCGFFCTL